MKKYIKLVILLFFLSIKVIYATTIKETLIKGDGYDTILPNTFIIGVTKFSGDEVITASKAATAGANDAMIYALKHGTTRGYRPPTIYYYVDANVGWFQFDSNNVASAVTDSETLNMLSNLEIYYVNNVEKKIDVAYHGDDIDLDSLEDGVEYKDGFFYVNASTSQFSATTLSGNEVSFIKDANTSKFMEDNSSCYDFSNGVILNYDASCGSEVTIPSLINGESVTGIGENAFNGKNLTEVVIPSSVVAIGNNAFFNNDNLTVITLDGKYDNTDFTSLNDNAFPANVTVDYSNELTRAMKTLPSEYVIPVYSDIDTDHTDMIPLITNEIFKEINTEKYNFHIEKEYLDKYYMIHYYMDNVLQSNDGKCVDHVGSSFEIYFFVENNHTINIFFEKRSNNCTRVIKINKKLNFIYEKEGNLIDKLSVDNSIGSLGLVETDVTDSNFVTNRRNLEDYVDNNRLDYIFNSINGRVIEPKEDEEIGGSITTGYLYLFKNDILYKVIDNVSVLNLSNIYYPNINPNDYESSDDLKSAMIHSFEEKTDIHNYMILKLEQDKELLHKIGGARSVYYMALFNRDTLEYWSIYLKTIPEDKYDSFGYTLGSCFTISDNTITKYDGTCGANVKIPDKINNNYVYKIGNEVFYDYGLKSISLPDHLVEIGENAFFHNDISELVLPDLVKTIHFNAFAKNKITSLKVPYTVTYIGENAFSSNQLSYLKLSDSLQSLGQAAFSDNQLEGSDAFVYEREYDYTNEKYYINTSKINSYAGKNRNEVIIPSQVTDIGSNAFKGLGIKKINIPYGVTHIGYYAFAENKMESITIPDTVQSIEWGAFANNKFDGDNSFIYSRDRNGNVDKSVLMAYSYIIPDNYSYLKVNQLIIPSSVKKIYENAFSNGSGLYVDDLIVPYGVEEIGYGAFVNVTVKNTIYLPKSITKLGGCIFSFSNTNNPYVYAKNEDGTKDESVLMAYTSNDYQDEIVLPSSIKQIRENAFYGRNIKHVVFNDELEEIGENAFSNMYYLDDVMLPSSLKRIGKYAFASNTSFRNLVLNDGLEEIGEWAFYGNKFHSISIPSSVKKIEDYAFYTDYVNDEDDTISITLKEGLLEIGNNAFYTMARLEEISIPASVRIIGNNAFGSVEKVIVHGKASFDEFDNDVYLKDSSDIIVEFVVS